MKTVGELIEELQQHDPELPVVIPGSGVHLGLPAVDVRRVEKKRYWQSDAGDVDRYDERRPHKELGAELQRVEVVQLA